MDSIPRSILDSQKAFAVDWRSHSTPPPNPRPTSSVYSDDTSIMVCLIRRVSEEIRAQEDWTIVSCIERESGARGGTRTSSEGVE
jgi:hypothetical protein